MKKRLLICLTALSLLMLTGCGPADTTTTTTTTSNNSSESSAADNSSDADAEKNAEAENADADESSEAAGENENEHADTVTKENAEAPASAEVTDRRDFVITLYPDKAPISCENFEKLVSEGFYNGLTFHRVVEDFMAQGGDPMGNGMGGSEENIKGEFSANGVNNDLSHQRGIVSMARSMDPDSASSQFFICYTDCSFLDGNYAAFGEVTDGMEVVDAFLAVPRSMGGDGAVSSPDTKIVIKEAVMMDADENGNPRVHMTMDEFIK